MKFEGMESHVGSVMDIPSGSALPTKVQEGNLFLQTGAVPVLFFGLTTGWSKVIASLDVITEGATNKYFTQPRVLATPVTGVSLASTTTQVTATDTLLVALGKLQGQLVAQLATITSQVSSVTTNTTNLTNHMGSGGTSHSVATSTTAGFMSAADKTNLDGHLNSTTGHPNVTTTTNGFMLATDKVILNNHVGAASGHPNATQSANGFMAATDKVILDGHVGSTSGHPNATTAANGFMAATDKVKLDGLPTVTMKYMTVDVMNSTGLTANTLVAIPEMTFDVVAGITYTFKFMIGYTSSATANGSRWIINGPTATWLSYTSRYPLTATTETVNYASAYAIPTASNASSLATGNLAVVEGILKPSVNGTVAMSFASESLGSVITAKAGSSLHVISHA